jgi:hypothetical protein
VTANFLPGISALVVSSLLASLSKANLAKTESDAE